ncbi:hypothetical protein LSH36_96g06009 [Paralvinella palmiformis]|uniref:MIR domain-containing protein n=1 Tax=Paralvinella palmiformis TaxID=53620 RepID=A0AAD9K1A2_9ANNE|nr:hypothetical protein LSH36_96g06009 [Paralvinella palmiformis]
MNSVTFVPMPPDINVMMAGCVLVLLSICSISVVSLITAVAYGSVVTIKNYRTAGGYLHSHPHLYPEGIGVRQQQVTTYSHKDENNKWRLKPHNREVAEGEPVTMVKNGDLVRLEHTMTRRNLHSHRERAPLSRQHYQVTCYGMNGTGDINDVFRLEVPNHQGEPLRTVRSVFRLVHYKTGCAVFSHSKQLPKWPTKNLGNRRKTTSEKNGRMTSRAIGYFLVNFGFYRRKRQIRDFKLTLSLRSGIVIGPVLNLDGGRVAVSRVGSLVNMKSALIQSDVTRCVIPGSSVVLTAPGTLPNTSFEVYAPTFIEKLIESHAVMMQGNKNLKPKEGEVTSRPWQWPLNYKGQPFSGSEYRVYLLGNPVIWWLNLFIMIVFSLFGVVLLTQRQRYPRQQLSDNSYNMLCSCFWLLLGWLFHYLPFWTMTRILYFHHYFPAFLYNSMITGIFIDYFLKTGSQHLRRFNDHILYIASLSAVLLIIIYSFILFNPLSYGMVGPDSKHVDSFYTHLRWLDTWDI